MPPSVSTLYPPAEPRPAALALRLNPEILHELRRLHNAQKKAKLIVKDGKFQIKVSETLSYPCSASPETLRLDVYSPASPRSRKYAFTGTVTNRLNVLSDPKQIREHARLPVASESPVLAPPPSAANGPASPSEVPVCSSSFDSKAYAITASDSDSERVSKFVSLLALGPMTRPTIEEKLQLSRFVRAAEADRLFSTHTQPYLRKDTFTEGDVYPLLSLGHTIDVNSQNIYLILKDKAYKEIRPWQWSAYTDYERQLILKNCNNALSRLGFSDTHPLRSRIVERTSPVRPVKKSTSLGGGLLVSSTKKQPMTPPMPHDSATPGPESPVSSARTKGRAFTESPKLTSEARKRFAEKGRKSIGSPLRQEELHPLSGVVSSSSSEDEKLMRRDKGSKRNSNASTQSSNNSYTSPSSVNDDGHSDQSDHDVKPHSVVQSVPAQVAKTLPNRPSSSFTNHEKKQQYYAQLAEKFRSRYKEYERLHKQLSKDSRKNTHIEKKKSLMKLFELHNTLSEWKRRIWDYHNENSMAEGVMNLSKHRKSNSLSKISTSAPSTSKISSTDRFHSGTGNSGASTSEVFRKQAFYERPTPQRNKFALDY